MIGAALSVFLGCRAPKPVPHHRPVPPPPPPLPVLSTNYVRPVLLSPSGLRMAKPKLQAAPSGGIMLGWNPVTNTSTNFLGYAVVYGIAPGNYLWRSDVGTNTEASILPPFGGMTYFFACESYTLYYQGVYSHGSNLLKTVEINSTPSAEVSTVAVCPINVLQGPLITNGVWVVAANVPPGWLQSSSIYGNFTNLFKATNGVNVFSGPKVAGNQFFRFAAMQLLPTNSFYTQEASFLYNGLVVGNTYTAVFGTNEVGAIMNPHGVGGNPVTIQNGIPFIATQNPLQFNGITPSNSVTAKLYLNP